jgi:hypothetical protein
MITFIPCECIGGESDLFRLGIYVARDLLSDGFAIGEPAVPVHVAVAHHLFVIAGRGGLRGN